MVVQRLKRLKGKLGCYLSEGAVEAGAVVTADIETSALGRVRFNFTVPSAVYAAPGTFVKVGEVPIDLSDYDFSPGGLVAHVAIQDVAITRRTPADQVGSYQLVKGRHEYSVPGLYRIIGDQPGTAMGGSFEIVRQACDSIMAGSFEVVALQPSGAVSGAFTVSAATPSVDVPGSFRVVRSTTRSALTVSGQFAVV